MRISIFGMGYVGVVSAACLLKDGHAITGVDINHSKVKDLAAGRSPIQEPGVAALLQAGYEAGRLSATTDTNVGVESSDMIWICVGTPSLRDGGLDLTAVEAVATQIGGCLRTSPARPLIVLRSTLLPGTTAHRFIPAIERASGLSVGQEIDVLFHPEFLREGAAVADFNEPPKIVLGEQRAGSGDALMEVYRDYSAPRHRVSLSESEMVKYADNLFHALKITFANEIGAVAKASGVDGRRVADIFCSDTKLNISARYLRPGFAFGGSCLPKDLRAIIRHAELLSVPIPMLGSMLRSNQDQVDTLVDLIISHKVQKVGMIGLAFKADTDDMRESPYVAVAKRLIGEGIHLSIYDPTVRTERLIGSNKLAVQAALQHLEQLLVDSIDELSECELILVNHRIIDADSVSKLLQEGKKVIDLADIPGVSREVSGYEGIAW